MGIVETWLVLASDTFSLLSEHAVPAVQANPAVIDPVGPLPGWNTRAEIPMPC